ncbi:MAG: restriction endonuclease subunit S [Bacteroidales bacterium]|nr:restriction endonuclease subunit S [Bacteroidales bacterium]
MKSNYKRIGNYIQLVDKRNKGLKVDKLLGLSISKQFIPSVANIIGTDMENYKIISKNQFACSLMQVRRDKKMPVALLQDFDKAIISQAYPVFEVKNKKELIPEYLMMWFSRSEFDRETCFHAVGGVRGSLEWEDFCDLKLPIPSIEKQREIVEEYNTIQNRITLNQNLIQKLESTAQAIYKEWFVDGIDKENLPEGWRIGTIGDYAKVKSGFAFKSEWWQQEGVPVIKIGSINNNTIDTNMLDYVSSDIIDRAKNYKVKKADIVIAMTGATIGKIGLIPELNSTILVNQRVGMFDLGNNSIEKAPFLYINLLNDSTQNEIINVGGDSAQANISNSQIESIEMIYPAEELIENYNRICHPLFELILNKINENQKLKELKELLLSKLAKEI